ncbi:hypothetical protein BV898_05627 [Hypsibius exemplaris]|uniref:Uncharacterized protein n=1 Tax=Hypsibius exemplaris TaxID=2072580 RepID=A0A1W0WYR6_HYPEX|nr:hypothetical protein BV898_05627 [Hypsibius exemplaris]
MWTLCCLLLSSLAFVSAERIYGQATTRRHGGIRVDPNEMYVRIQAEIIKLTNEKGLTSVNSYCDTLGACDPVCYAHLDTDRPNAEWPGGVALDYWPEIIRVDNNNSPYINKSITRDSCAKPYRESVLRVYCEDYDPASSNDLINQWECPITRNPADSENGAPWSVISDCTPRFHPGAPNSIRQFGPSKGMSTRKDVGLVFSYPEETGLPLDVDSSGPYVLLKVHYANHPKIVFLSEAVRDSSGILLTTSDTLRRHTPALLTTGLSQFDCAKSGLYGGCGRVASLCLRRKVLVSAKQHMRNPSCPELSKIQFVVQNDIQSSRADGEFNLNLLPDSMGILGDVAILRGVTNVAGRPENGTPPSVFLPFLNSRKYLHTA